MVDIWGDEKRKIRWVWRMKGEGEKEKKSVSWKDGRRVAVDKVVVIHLL